MITVPSDSKVNLQLVYWEDQSHLKMCQNPDTILSVTRGGTNIYNLLPYDIQIVNKFRQNTTTTIVDNLSLAPTMIDVFIAGPPDVEQFPPTKQYVDFQMYLQDLKQLRWEVIRKLSISEERKLQLLQGREDSLDDGELFQLARSMKSEHLNIEYKNLILTREDSFISQFQPETNLIPEVRHTMDLKNMERSFIHMCKPHVNCVLKKTEPYFKDGMDFQTMTECVDYKLTEITAQRSWKKDRQLFKDLHIKLPVSRSFYEWKIRKEQKIAVDPKQNYNRCLAQMESLIEDCDIKDLYMAKQIENGERRLIQEMKVKMNELWLLQKEKKTVSDGQLFDLSMINPRCLPYVNKVLKCPNKEPKMEIIEEETESDSSEEWSGEWSITSSWGDDE